MTKLYIVNDPEAGRPFELKEGLAYLGRSAENDIQIEDKTVSRKHLRILKKRPHGFRREDISFFMDLSQGTALAIEAARLTSELSEIADELSSDNKE
jgi:pSer/pThr/pTyr-binding forkhead associated (FHA) protein